MQMQQQECCCEFLSTPSARRATSCAGHQIAETRISIHALREEGDAMCVAFSSAKAYFYPRPPRGGRRFDASEHITWYLFLSTPSARRATISKSLENIDAFISIHALREEGDHGDSSRKIRAPYISIHALREEGDRMHYSQYKAAYRFLSTPSARRATR